MHAAGIGMLRTGGIAVNTAPADASGSKGLLDGFLTTIERVGNKVPHPAIIFFWLIGLVVVLSAILGFAGWSATYEAVDPVTHEVVTRTTTVRSLLSREGVAFLVTSTCLTSSASARSA